MQILDKTLEEFVELFQGSLTYFGASKPLGQTRSRDGKQEFKHWVEPKPMTRENWLKGNTHSSHSDQNPTDSI